MSCHIPLPDVRFVRAFERGSFKYWEVVRDVMTCTGASQEEAERFVKAQKPCLEPLKQGG